MLSEHASQQNSLTLNANSTVFEINIFYVIVPQGHQMWVFLVLALCRYVPSDVFSIYRVALHNHQLEKRKNKTGRGITSPGSARWKQSERIAAFSKRSISFVFSLNDCNIQSPYFFFFHVLCVWRSITELNFIFGLFVKGEECRNVIMHVCWC